MPNGAVKAPPEKGLLKNPTLGAGAFGTLIPASQTLILSRRVSAVSKV